MQNTTHYNLKKPDYTDFADIQDINDNMDTIDEQLAAPTGDGREQTVSFTDADLDSGITSFPTFLTKIVSGMKMAKFLRDFKAGMAYVLHVGDLINNATCTESGKALDARMGKVLQDQITSLNDSLTNYITLINSFLIVDVYNALRIARQNFGTTMTFNVLNSGNNCGIIVTGNPSETPSASVSLWAFIARPSSTTIYIYKIGGNNNVTLSAVCTSNGKITITASESCAMFAVYCGAIS